jgi:phosphoglycolate phosphatase
MERSLAPSRHPNHPEAVVFDLDGTLVDTVGDIHEALNAALTEHGIDRLARDAVLPCIGEGGSALVRAALAKPRRRHGEATVAQIQESYYRAYERGNNAHARLYPQAREILSGLRRGGVRLAVCTNKSERLAAPLLDILGLSSLLDAVVYGDSLPDLKPSPLPLVHLMRKLGATAKRSAMVGDTRIDALAAGQARVPFVWISHGYGQPPPATAHRIIPGFGELPAALCALVESP